MFHLKWCAQKIECFGVFLTVLFATSGALAQIERQGEPCEHGACVIVEHDPSLAAEATLLVETLRLRLCRRGVHVRLGDEPKNGTEVLDKPGTEGNGECPPFKNPGEHKGNVWWVAHLRTLSDDYLLVAVDHLGSQSNEDFIREVPRGSERRATAWTVALMIEEALMPYLENSEELAPVGAGLAIIEPPAVGGMKKEEVESKRSYPLLRCFGVGLEIIYLGMATDSVSDFLVGPRATAQGVLGPRFIASLSAGWIGTGNFRHRESGVRGSVSHIPLDLLLGYVLVQNSHLQFVGSGGFSAGFTVYKTKAEEEEESRTDIVFDPWVQVVLELDVFIYGPLAAYVNTGVALPIRHDVLVNQGEEVYRQDWIMPLVGLGLQIWI